MVTRETANQQTAGIFPEELRRGVRSNRRLRGEPVSLRGKPLSLREKAVIAALQEGLTNKAIGQRLGLTEGTVKVYLSTVYAKTGLNRMELALAELRKENALLALELKNQGEESK